MASCNVCATCNHVHQLWQRHHSVFVTTSTFLLGYSHCHPPPWFSCHGFLTKLMEMTISISFMFSRMKTHSFSPLNGNMNIIHCLGLNWDCFCFPHSLFRCNCYPRNLRLLSIGTSIGWLRLAGQHTQTHVILWHNHNYSGQQQNLRRLTLSGRGVIFNNLRSTSAYSKQLTWSEDSPHGSVWIQMFLSTLSEQMIASHSI